MEEVTKLIAVSSLVPKEARWILRDDSLDWYSDDITQPTEQEIADEITRLQAEYDANQYQRDRKAEYPSIEECVHAMLDGDLDELQARRQEVKERFPK